MSIIALQRRIVEAGRIRIGQQVAAGNGKTRPEKLETFRITSADRRRIEQAAERYGGKVEPWQAPAGPQWQVITEAVELDVIVPPSDLSFSQHYELWSAGGCQRRCDGVTELLTEQPCLCDPDNRECDIHTRLSVMLRDLPGLGVFRLDTSGWYAAVELAGVVEVLGIAAGRGALLPARLRLEQRSVKRPGKGGKPQTLRFAVPVLDIEISPAQLLAGGANPLQLAQVADSQPSSFDPVPVTPAAFLPTIAEQSERPAQRPRAANAAPEIPSSGRSRRSRAASPSVDEGESEAGEGTAGRAEPAAASVQGAPAGGSPPARPRRPLPPKAASTDPGDAAYWPNRVHAVAAERGIDHDGVRLIAAAVCGIELTEFEQFTTKDLVEVQWQEIDSLIRSLPAEVKGADADADLDAISTWLWPRAQAKGLDAWSAIDAVAVAATGKQPDLLTVSEWVAFAARLAAGEYDAAQKAS